MAAISGVSVERGSVNCEADWQSGTHCHVQMAGAPHVHTFVPSQCFKPFASVVLVSGSGCCECQQHLVLSTSSALRYRPLGSAAISAHVLGTFFSMTLIISLLFDALDIKAFGPSAWASDESGRYDDNVNPKDLPQPACLYCWSSISSTHHFCHRLLQGFGLLRYLAIAFHTQSRVFPLDKCIHIAAHTY